MVPSFWPGARVQRVDGGDAGEPGAVVDQAGGLVTVEWESGGRSSLHWQHITHLDSR
ncbi:hypothetical protein [Williamsia sterculiae]|uniref:DUF4314 domain-containing protein n=1 Tax=Williamsia sterculiae TaxID=1344003 RepID=A0A1N7HE95_9NOCA|nr:hypothetical protein [Williamsia sterculiae]SIS23061.1 hypothetical protein SAMN05445060_4043 [Williamsia sterculiae]